MSFIGEAQSRNWRWSWNRFIRPDKKEVG